MVATDHPLKLLVSQFTLDFAAWLLQTDVVSAQQLNVELSTESVRLDSVFRVVKADGEPVVLHIEFQGRRSALPMALRQLNYQARLIVEHGLPVTLNSYVLYVEQYAGAQDTGEYVVRDSRGNVSVTWNYTPVHLWQMPASEIVALGRNGILPLIGLADIDEPSQTLPQVVNRIRQEPDQELRSGLFNALLSLMEDKECLAMLEKMLEDEELLLDTPYLRRQREQGHAEGFAEGREEGRVEGQRRGLRIAIKSFLLAEFDPPYSKVKQLEDELTTIEDVATLESLVTVAARAESFEAFVQHLAEKVLSPNGDETEVEQA